MYGGLIIQQKRDEKQAQVLYWPEFGTALDYFIANEKLDIRMELYKRRYRGRGMAKKFPSYNLIRLKEFNGKAG